MAVVYMVRKDLEVATHLVTRQESEVPVFVSVVVSPRKPSKSQYHITLLELSVMVRDWKLSAGHRRCPSPFKDPSIHTTTFTRLKVEHFVCLVTILSGLWSLALSAISTALVSSAPSTLELLILGIEPFRRMVLCCRYPSVSYTGSSTVAVTCLDVHIPLPISGSTRKSKRERIS